MKARSSNRLPRFRWPADDMPTADMAEAYRRDGTLIVEGFFDPATCQRLRANAAARATADKLLEAAAEAAQAGRTYFETAWRMDVLLEPKAFRADGTLTVPMEKAVCKIGNALQDLDPEFSAVSRSVRMKRLAAAIGLVRPLLLQGQFLYKMPGLEVDSPLHQDATYLFTDPVTTVGFWVALEEATEANGCLRILPGRHTEPLRRRSRLSSDGKSQIFEVFDPAP